MGEDVESILHKLYMESGQDIERCQRGIVYLDEIDKVGVRLFSLVDEIGKVGVGVCSGVFIGPSPPSYTTPVGSV